jgi:hypothetical protein
MAVPAGLEPATSAFEARHSIQLSYGTDAHPSSLGGSDSKNQVLRVSPWVPIRAPAHRTCALCPIKVDGRGVDGDNVESRLRYAPFVQSLQQPSEHGFADPPPAIGGQKIEGPDAIRVGVPQADDDAPIGRDQQHAPIPQGPEPALLALDDIEGVGLRAEQRSVGLPVRLGVTARNIRHVCQGRSPDLDHSCAEPQKETLDCMIL